MAHLSLTFLGSFQVMLDGEPLTGFRSVKVQGLLAYLALTNQHSHSRDTLAALFWPNESDTIAKKNLRQSLYQLRQVLEEGDWPENPYILVTRSTVQFDPASDHTLDVTEFLNYLENTQLQEAIALYPGNLLPGFTCDSLPFEEWLREERERLRRLALDALFELTDRSLARGDYQTAQNLAQQQLTFESWREEAHRQLIQALALLGERSAALAQYEACRSVLNEELGAEPSGETEALIARIRTQQSGHGSPEPSRHAFGRRRLAIPFVGRESEHDVLVRNYKRACNDGLQVVTLLGETGIGKTRLAEYFLDWAATNGADILRGRAFETSGGLSYQPLTQALRQRLERENAPEDLLSDLWLTQLTRILPELRDRYPDLPAPTQEEATARQHLFEAITRVVQALTERAPIIVFIDDWHWADTASMDVLHYSALRWSEELSPVLVLLTIRQESLMESPELQTWLTRLKHNVTCEQLDLAALSGAETEHLIHALLKPENNGSPHNGEKTSQLSRFSRWLFSETDGQPFFLVETLKAMVEDGLVEPDVNSEAWHIDLTKFDSEVVETKSYLSAGVREIIRNWLGRISTSAAELLAASAVLGQQIAFDHLCRVADIDENKAVTALDELLVRQLLLEVDEDTAGLGDDLAYSFSHQMLGEVVYEEAGAARRRILHRRAFEALEESGAPNAELARHARYAGLGNETIEYSIAAGNDAMHLFAAPIAVTHYETAWQLADQKGWPESISDSDKQALYLGLGRAYELTEAWTQAQETYQAMIADARSAGAANLECLGLNHLATVYFNGFHDFRQAEALLEEARAVAEQSGDRPGLAQTEWNLSTAARMEDKTNLARRHGEQSLKIARELEDPQLIAGCLNALAYVHGRLRQWGTVEIYANEASSLYGAADNLVLEADSQRMLGWSQAYSGQPQKSEATLRSTLAFSQQIENSWGEIEASWRLAFALVELGKYGEAITLARQAALQAPQVGPPAMVIMSLSAWGTVQRTVMALEAAHDTLLEALERTSSHDWGGFEDWFLAELCAVHALAGDWEQAHDYARRVLQVRKDESLLPIALIGWYETEALLRGRDGDLARTEVNRLSKIAGDKKRFQLPLLRSQAVLAQWDGEIDHAIEHLQEAVSLAQEIGLPGEEWSILSALGNLYAEQGNQVEAQQAWKASGDILLRLAETIDETNLREGFLAAEPVRTVLAHK